MLVDSIKSFRAILGSRANYVVHTDDPRHVKRYLRGIADVFAFSDYHNPSFATFTGPTWGKWCPCPRLAPGDLEVHVDADVFLLAEPVEIFTLLDSRNKMKYLVLEEFKGESWQRGCFADMIPSSVPFINAGLFAQGPNGDISESMQTQYDWWLSKRHLLKETFHDEQGALTLAIANDFETGYADVLPKDRYVIISPRSNREISSLEGLVLFHATHPDHPAYHRFKNIVRGVGR
ncbi:hypothetical protein [Geobacter sulfurreducens]|uniref:hypothetical protein n=1 Tax=Geobacter sulfurreducens TaxID=35554 RepID=UPI00257416A3|nr:hypothetical protein [Geobacter sulfurreducens]